MNTAPTLSDQSSVSSRAADTNAAGPGLSWLSRLESANPPEVAQWLRYWNDDDTDVGNLRNLQHWLSRSRGSPSIK